MLLFVISLLVGSPDPTPAELLEKVHARYRDTKDLSALFTQTVSLRYQKKGQTVTGAVKVKTGNKFRLESDRQTIVTNGTTTWLYDPSTKQVLKSPFKKGSKQMTPDKFLLGLPKELNPKSAERSGDRMVLTVEPSAGSALAAMIVQARLWVDAATGNFDKIEYSDKNGTTYSTVLTDVKINAGITDTVFEFTVTPEMRVVDMSAGHPAP